MQLLGSGGGGRPGVHGKILRLLLGEGHISLCAPGDLPARHVVPVGIVGSTSLFLERLPRGGELSVAVQAVAQWTGVDAGAVMNIEAGGLNGLVGLVASLELSLPFLDADLMGRALPRLDQLSWAVEGRPITPCALSEPSGQVLVIDGASPVALERTARSFLSACGGWACIALPPMPAEEVSAISVIGSVSHALAMGRAGAALDDTPAPAAVERVLGCRVLADGRVSGVSRYAARPGFGRGSVTVLDRLSGAVVRVESENEYLLALVDGDPEAETPDLICLLDRRSGVPLGADDVRSGDEVLVVTMPGPAYWTEEAYRRRRVDLVAFGLERPTREPDTL